MPCASDTDWYTESSRLMRGNESLQWAQLSVVAVHPEAAAVQHRLVSDCHHQAALDASDLETALVQHLGEDRLTLWEESQPAVETELLTTMGEACAQLVAVVADWRPLAPTAGWQYCTHSTTLQVIFFLLHSIRSNRDDEPCYGLLSISSQTHYF